MQSSFFILHALAELLHKDLQKAVLLECFSWQQEEAVLIFKKQDGQLFYIKVLLKDTFQCLYVPDDVSKPKQNTHPHFMDVYGMSVSKVYSGVNDRSLIVELIDGSCIVFKMYANRSNVLLLSENGIVTEIVKKVHRADMSFSLSSVYKAMPYSTGKTMDELLKAWYLPADANAYIKKQIGFALDEDVLMRLDELRQQFLTEQNYYIQLKDGNISFCLWKSDETVFITTDLYEALRTFVHFYFRYNFYQERKQKLQTVLIKKAEAAQKYIAKTTEQLTLLMEQIPPNEIADIIMANIHDWNPKDKERELFDFYRNQPIRIQLKEKLSPQKMAEALYKKSKNRFRQFKQLENIINDRKEKLKQFTEDLNALASFNDYKQLQAIELKYQKEEKAVEEAFPFKKYLFKGFEIWVGRNAANNELLTLKYAHKDDLWLHARNVPGSHVIIKYQSGKTFPSDVIERAAELAAYFSTLKNDSLCPVSYTQKKYVHKFKGGAIGSMKMEREEVMMVTPKE